VTSWHSYPSIYNLGHRAVRDLLAFPHIIEEKIDGSQFSFGAFETAEGDRELRVRSKGAVMHVDAPEKMFAKAVEAVKGRFDGLHVGWTYRGEYLAKPKHNALAYDRTPRDHIIIFDVSTGEECWLGLDEKQQEAERLGFECVPQLAVDQAGGTTTLGSLREILDHTQSVLGGQLIEGVVIKPLGELYGSDKRTLMGKFVSERFKEVHKVEWKKTNPSNADVLARLIDAYKTPARWQKAVQHLRDAGCLEDSPRDIGNLLIEVQKDLGKECKEEIQAALWKWAWPHISRGVIAGLPEWYKHELLRLQFERPEHVG